MKYIVSDNRDLSLMEETAIVIGNFDGVHVAHRRLIGMAVDFAKKTKMKSVVLTFRPHTAHIFDKFGSPHLIMSYAEKIKEISGLGVDILIEQRFDHLFASLSTEEFLHGYLKGLNVRAIFVGYDFNFSRGKQANQETLRVFGHNTGTYIEIMEPQLYSGTKISSTKIRNLLSEGNIEIANKLLGGRYFISGEVVRGKGLARRLGIATANIPIIERLIPREGVYLTLTDVEGIKYRSVSNIGKTYYNKEIPILESHILDFDKELYDKEIKVEFIRFLRPEIRFGSLDELREAVTRDIKNARQIFEGLCEDC